jgi:hypothetical protein
VIAPSPLLTTVAAFAPLLREAEGGGPWLEKVAAGQISGTVAFDPEHVLCALEVDVVAALVDDHVVLIPAAEANLRPIRALDATRTLAAIDTSAAGDCERLPISPEGVERARQEITTAIAFELVGTCESIFDTNLEYAKERKQFGVPIGSFQAIQHKLADMSLALERATAAVYYAAMTVDAADPDRSRAGHVAKAAAGEAARRILKDGIQIHGGIGYTWEHDMHLYVKRAKSNDAFFGGTAWHRSRIASLLGL